MKPFKTIGFCLFFLSPIWVGLVFLVGSITRAFANENDSNNDFDPLPGRTDEQISELIYNFDEVIETIALYASLTSVLFILLAISIALRLKSWSVYVGLVILSLFWFAFFEQHITGQFWIGLPADYQTVLVPGLALASLHFIVSGMLIDKSSRLHRLRWIHFFSASRSDRLIWASRLAFSRDLRIEASRSDRIRRMWRVKNRAKKAITAMIATRAMKIVSNSSPSSPNIMIAMPASPATMTNANPFRAAPSVGLSVVCHVEMGTIWDKQAKVVIR